MERRILSKVWPHYTPVDLLYLERILTKRFARASRLYYTSAQAPTNTLDWWAEMQHYGMPTRLLDFTWSPYVACFFAVENAAEAHDHVVWAWRFQLHPTHLLDYPAEVDNFIRTVFEGEVDQALIDSGAFWENANLVDGFVDEAQRGGLRAVIMLSTERVNARMISQQGLFVMPTSLDVGFMACLEQSELHVNPESLIKVVLPHALRDDILDDLLRMNITRGTLFPGLEGFARHLGDTFERVLSLHPETLQVSRGGRQDE